MKKTVIKDYAYRISAGISNAVLVCLGIGLLFETLGNLTGIIGITQIGTIAKMLLAPAFGAAIAFQLKTNTLVVFSSMIASTVGANAISFTQAPVEGLAVTGSVAAQAAGGLVINSGQPISAVLAGIIAALVGKYLTGKTPLDMLLVPFSSLFIGGVSGILLAKVTTPLLLSVSAFMASSIAISPIIGSIVIALCWSTLLMTPASSVAIAIALQLDPASSAAALIGCTAQFIGFTVMSWKVNKPGANIAQCFITPKIQFPNLINHPQMIIPPFIAAAICAPLATVAFNFRVSYELAGLGLNSLIVPLNLWSSDFNSFMTFILVGVVLSAALTFLIYSVMLMMGRAKRDNLVIELQ